jgi:imidazolonepropionase-like amidohydrolase
LRAATIGPANSLSKGKEFGSIAVGQRADLLPVAGNPLENIGNMIIPTA